MKVIIETIDRGKEEHIRIACYEINQEVEEITRFATSYNKSMQVYDEQGVRSVLLSDIYYIEAVDQKVFVYLEQAVYELKMRLYEFEERFSELSFLRCSKSNIINLLKIKALKPALNGRLCAILYNEEKVIIARKYVPKLKKELLGGSENE
jgi:DNA-binding LytR/AlgR family response regulator